MSGGVREAFRRRFGQFHNFAVAAVLVVLLFSTLTVGYTVFGQRHVISLPVVTERVLLDGVIHINGLYYVEFIIPKGAHQIRLSGNFTMSEGGSIRVYVMNETNFNGLGLEGFNFCPDYDSRQATAGNITATLNSAGTYYLIYDSSIGYTTERAVTTQVNLNYLLT